MTTKPPRRKAHAADREYAAELARRYRERDPYRVEIDGRTVELHVTGDELAKALECFAEDGTFGVVGAELPRAERVAIIRDTFRRLRAAGMGQEDAIVAIAERRGVHEQTIRDALYRGKRRTA